VVSTLAALSCCLPLAPFLLAFGFAGASGVFLTLQPYLAGLSLVMLVVGFVQAFRTRKCGRKRVALNLTVLLVATVMVGTMLFATAPGTAPPGQPAVAKLDLAAFRDSFNAAVDHTRVVALLSPT
jgi:uncharacterized membrane protein YczE